MRTINALVSFAFASTLMGASIQPVPPRVPAKLPDAAEVLPPSQVHLDGWLGGRLTANATNRLLTVAEAPLLAGFQKKPGTHPWIGEHVGKWLHAATLAWAYTGDPALRAKLDRVAAELIRCQEPDGYLGTYVPEKRFGLYQNADWDVWSHKYNLIGLLTYYEYTGEVAALDACRKMGDLLIRTFPAKKSILAAGTHVGMAATSVLEPIAVLYRFTGDERYLAFARYLVKAWDEPNGPKIIATLLAEKQVNKTANAKAYEMLSNLVGLCELARATGDRALLEPVLNAWTDVVQNRLYLTGSASQGEHFRGDHELPNDTAAHVAETCVTTTWIQLNLQLLRLTGEARFGNELERTIYNHLAAAQHPRGDDWCYFTSLEGRKPYDSGINCCHSSGPRGMALAPFTAYLRSSNTLLVGTLETSTAALTLDGQRVEVRQESGFPRQGRSTITLKLAAPAKFAIKVRVPEWAGPVTVEAGGAKATVADGWATVGTRTWKDGDRLEITFSLGASVIAGKHGNEAKQALRWGPFVLAYDDGANGGKPAASSVTLPELSKPPFELGAKSPLAAASRDAAPVTYQWYRSPLAPEPLQFTVPVRTRRSATVTPVTFVPFADAGSTGGNYRVWLRAGDPGGGADSLLVDGEETRSRGGNVAGSINDGDAASFVVTFNNQPAAEDWFAVTLAEPARVGRIVFAHGRTFHDGGWFDASAGKPRVQLQRQKGGAWETLGTLDDYPATTATDSKGVRSGQKFTLKLAQPVEAVAIRVIGKPASGDNSMQSFASCGELEAFSQ